MLSTISRIGVAPIDPVGSGFDRRFPQPLRLPLPFPGKSERNWRRVGNIATRHQRFSLWRWTRFPGSAGVSPASTSLRAPRACRRDAGAPRGGRDRSAALLWAKMRIA